MIKEATSKSRDEKARKIVENKGVKLHRFSPSLREIWTVVGREGDALVDTSSSYCSCADFHFRVLSGSVAECYHLLAVRQAQKKGEYVTVSFSDNEYAAFLKALLRDIFSNISRT